MNDIKKLFDLVEGEWYKTNDLKNELVNLLLSAYSRYKVQSEKRSSCKSKHTTYCSTDKETGFIKGSIGKNIVIIAVVN